MRGLVGGLLAGMTVLALVAVSGSGAEENKESKGSYGLEEIVVSGKKGVREPVASRYWVPESSTLQTEVFTREDIEAIHPETVFDVLQFAPGIEYTYQGRRQFDFTNMRGQGSLGLIIDGTYIPTGSFTQRILATFPMDTVDSIRIVRDATALTLGPLTNFGSGNGSSNQGFIIIKTKRAAKLEGGFVASYGSFKTDKEHVYQGAKISDFDYRLAYTHQESEGKANWFNGMRNNAFTFHAGYSGKAFNGDVLYFTSRGMREMQRGEDYSGKLSNQRWWYDPMVSTLIGVNLSKPWTPTQTTTFGYSFNKRDFDTMTSTFTRPGFVTSTSSSTEWGQAFDLRHVVALEKDTIHVGGQMLSDRTVQDMYSLYAHEEHRMFGSRLSLDGGIRMDKKYYHESPVTNTDMNEWSKPVYTYAAGAAYKITPYLTATGRFAYSENTLASYQVDATTKGSLPAEKRLRYEGGLAGNFHPAFNPFLTVFYYDTKNQAVSTGKSYIDPDTGEEVDYVTPQDVRTKGIEIGVRGVFLGSFSYDANYSYMTTDNAAANRSQPHVTASGRLGYRFKDFEANVNARYYGPWSSSTSDGQPAKYDYGDFINVGANVSYQTMVFERPMKIMVYAQNLGDDHFTTRYRAGVGAFKDPGRRYGIELSCSLF